MMNDPIHDHNRDLILELADGALAGAELAAAEAELAACDECAAELAAQLMVVEVLRGAPRAELTELEAARMRRSLHQDLGLVTPEPVARSRPERSLRWRRMSIGLSAAAVAVLVVAVLPALNLFGASDNTAADQFVALPSTAQSVEELAPEAAGGSDPTGDPATTQVDAMTNLTGTTLAAAPADDGSLIIDFGPLEDLSAIADSAEAGYAAEGDVRHLSGLSGDFDSLPRDERADRCADGGLADRPAGHEATVLGRASLSGTDVFVVAYHDPASGNIEVVAHAADTCEVVATTGQP